MAVHRDRGGPQMQPKKIAHAGGKITTNKESALHTFVVRLLREGKPITRAQRTAAENVVSIQGATVVRTGRTRLVWVVLPLCTIPTCCNGWLTCCRVTATGGRCLQITRAPRRTRAAIKSPVVAVIVLGVTPRRRCCTLPYSWIIGLVLRKVICRGVALLLV